MFGFKKDLCEVKIPESEETIVGTGDAKGFVDEHAVHADADR